MIGVIGGSGVYEWSELSDVTRREVKTPFGLPSDAYVCGRVHGRAVCFLPRHAVGHRLLPSEINHRANIFGLKVLGVTRVISISAVGSLREEFRPRDIVLPDQYFDRTKASDRHTFFGNGVAGHVAFGEPTCAELRGHILAVARKAVTESGNGTRVIEGGTYVNMEGPAFSTKAESNVYRKLGFDVIGMTSLAEAKLCREAELCYQAIAMVTDYDCWHETEEAVTVEIVIGHLMANTALARSIVGELIHQLPEERACTCGQALRHAIITSRDCIPAEVKRSLAPIIGKYVGAV